MLRTLFSNRLFLGALAFFVLCVGGSLLYQQHVVQQGAEELAETQDRVSQWNENQPQPPAEAPVGGDFHEDGDPLPRETHAAVAASDISTPRGTSGIRRWCQPDKHLVKSVV